MTTTDARPVVVSRKLRESVSIGDARVLVSEIRPGRVTLRILAPPGTAVHRLDDHGRPVRDAVTATSGAVRLGPRMERERRLYEIATCPHPPESVAVLLERGRRVVRCGACNVRLVHPDDAGRAAEAVRALLALVAEQPEQSTRHVPPSLFVEIVERALVDLRLDLTPAPLVAAQARPDRDMVPPPVLDDERVRLAEARAQDATALLRDFMSGTIEHAPRSFGPAQGVERVCPGCDQATRHTHRPADCVLVLRSRLHTLDRERLDRARAAGSETGSEEGTEC